jgi:hypothetical protein
MKDELGTSEEYRRRADRARRLAAETRDLALKTQLGNVATTLLMLAEQMHRVEQRRKPVG